MNPLVGTIAWVVVTVLLLVWVITIARQPSHAKLVHGLERELTRARESGHECRCAAITRVLVDLGRTPVSDGGASPVGESDEESSRHGGAIEIASVDDGPDQRS